MEDPVITASDIKAALDAAAETLKRKRERKTPYKDFISWRPSPPKKEE